MDGWVWDDKSRQFLLNCCEMGWGIGRLVVQSADNDRLISFSKMA